MISNVLSGIQKVFQDEWLGEVHYNNTQYEAKAESWINVDVELIDTESFSYTGCVAEEHALYVTCYHKNQVKAAELADQVISFIQERAFDFGNTRTWRPVIQGMMEDNTAFYKISIPVEVIN